ncbi:MAG: SDR family oxidoreductase [Caldilineaceae bacterium]|nr:SDR family oxidoreductase [Caldilineaceae bacterium]
MADKAISRKLQGQVALVTGGGRGIGAAAAELLAAAGASLVLTARSEEEIDAVAQRIRGKGGKAIAVPCDVSDFGQIEEVIEAALDQFDRLDILINNAGLIWPLEEVVDSDPDEWAYNIHVNLVGPYNMARNILPVMIDQGYGRILNITSGAAAGSLIGVSAYSAAKAGLDAFTRTLAAEMAGTGVMVNGLKPGTVDTEMQADLRSVDTEGTKLDFSYFHTAYEGGRLGSPTETARQIYWLVGPWGRAETGKIFSAGDAEWRAQVDKDIS